jgi:tetratricopeptide (TPR) repeat protein
MRFRYFFFFSEKLGAFFFFAIFSLTILVFLIPQIAFSLGNIFFGDIPRLYNLNAAHFFFKEAAYPPLRDDSVPYAHYQLSRTFFIRGDLFSALDEARAEIAEFPEHSGTYYILGLTYGYMGRDHEAIDAFSRYIETHPETWAGRNDKAWLQFRIGDIDGALATMEPIGENFPYTPWVQNTLCALLINKKDRLADAEKACLRAKESIDRMTASEWGRSYPGNSPQIYENGLQSMRKSIEQNLAILIMQKEDLRKSSEQR